MKKRWMVISLCAGLLTLAITSGAIFAHGGSNGVANGQNNITTRVAELLGLETAEVQSAFDQAMREQQDAAISARLDRMVENEVVTQGQADDILEWYQGRPNLRWSHGILFFQGDAEQLQRKLNQVVENGRIAQEEADQIMEWFEARPEVVETIEKPRERGGHSGWNRSRHRRGGDAQFDRGSFGTPDVSLRAPNEAFQAPATEELVLY